VRRCKEIVGGWEDEADRSKDRPLQKLGLEFEAEGYEVPGDF